MLKYEHILCSSMFHGTYLFQTWLIQVETLLEIWHEYREETEKTLHRTRLPEPPAARDRLKQEIQFFVHSLQDKAKENGR